MYPQPNHTHFHLSRPAPHAQDSKPHGNTPSFTSYMAAMTLTSYLHFDWENPDARHSIPVRTLHHPRRLKPTFLPKLCSSTRQEALALACEKSEEVAARRKREQELLNERSRLASIFPTADKVYAHPHAARAPRQLGARAHLIEVHVHTSSRFTCTRAPRQPLE